MKMVNIKYFVLAVAVWASGCTANHNGDYEVLHAGQLRDIMHKNDISAKVAVDSLLERPGLFAVGSLDGLSGEIMIEDGVPFVSKAKGDVVAVSKDRDVAATLLVYAYVSGWEEMQLPDSVVSLEDLEIFLSRLRGADSSGKPLLFRLKGKPAFVKFHIIRPLAGHATHEEIRIAAFSNTLEGAKISIVGFYSEYHQGVFTHHDSNIHMHVINEERSKAGHVDDIRLDGNVKLYVPAE
ncbi:acetolactate decarboxylase [Fulvivirga ulvae]|uniref:acetolactate decarboxylase n=1 Tax=Fulvivirga ulvae TaxID=2904245 RepID=UPI001F240979|nr:acetolactate decarboxylase [Fulvivirga ulvae]UII33075.1 acetolactate decarboxylase [Fulvivirga ulvae]